MDIREELKYQIEYLRRESETAAVLVEGNRDRLALEYFRVKNIITISKPLYQIVEEISTEYKRCILLLDLDREGNKLYKKLKDDLQKYGVRIDSKFRSFLFKHTGLKEIEGLTSFFNHVAVRDYV
ncbi:MAG: toprim domain-containing protein [Nanoarchaeota archaeon]